MTVLQSPEVVLPEVVPETVPPVPVPLVPVLPAVLPLLVPVVVPELVPDVLPVVPPVVPVVPLVVPLIVLVVPLGSHTPSRGSCPGNTVHVAFRPQASKAKGSQSVAQVLDNAAAQKSPGTQAWEMVPRVAEARHPASCGPPCEHSPTFKLPTVAGRQEPSLVSTTLQVESRAPLPKPGPQALGWHSPLVQRVSRSGQSLSEAQGRSQSKRPKGLSTHVSGQPQSAEVLQVCSSFAGRLGLQADPLVEPLVPAAVPVVVAAPKDDDPEIPVPVAATLAPVTPVAPVTVTTELPVCPEVVWVPLLAVEREAPVEAELPYVVAPLVVSAVEPPLVSE